ncbi:MAG TPA: hypothetical protein PL033_11055 [Candidatus Brocadiia bacterium]|nr:hypothetical protein [Candidatus Brocadiia bacterium]
MSQGKDKEVLYSVSPATVRVIFAGLSLGMALTIVGHVLRQFTVGPAGGITTVLGWASCGLAAGALTEYIRPGRLRKLSALLLTLCLGVFVVYVGAQAVALSILRSDGDSASAAPPQGAANPELESRTEKALKSVRSQGPSLQSSLRNSGTVSALMMAVIELAGAFVFLVIVAEIVGIQREDGCAGRARSRANAAAAIYLLPAGAALIFAFFSPGRLRGSAESLSARMGPWAYAALGVWVFPLIWLVLSPLGMLKTLSEEREETKQPEKE